MVSGSPFPSSFVNMSYTSSYFSNSASRRIYSDVVEDIVINVDGQSFLLHKFPLISRSRKICKMLVDSQDPDLSNLELMDVPGGPETFGLVIKFCYGTDFEITTNNVAHLRCIAEYLEMTEDYKEENLVSLTETYLNNVVVQSLEKSIAVIRACENLLPIADKLGIVNMCVDALAMNVSKEQMVSGLAHLECDWWVEHLSPLRIDLFQRVVSAMGKTGVRSDIIAASLLSYAQTSLKGAGKSQVSDYDLLVRDGQKRLVETLVSLLVTEKITCVPLSFLFGMLRMAIIVDTAIDCREELERRIGFQLHMVSLDDLLIPSLHAGDPMFDVDSVHRILVNFLQRIEEEECDESLYTGYESEPPGSPSNGKVLKVGWLMDGYLFEIAADPNLKLHKFMAIIELLPDHAHVIEDGLYRAIDTYLKAHPELSESECRSLCKLIDCHKLSQEASDHAAQNERLPVQMVLRVLHSEQLRLKSSLSSDSGDGFFSHRIMSGSGVPSAAVSPRDNYASLRRENRELKLEISRMRVRLSDLEKEQEFMKQGMKHGKSTDHTAAFLAALSRGFGRISFFGQGGGGGRQKRCISKSQTLKSRNKRQQSGCSS